MRAPRERGVELGSQGPQLFLSHSSQDDQMVRRLAQDLNTCGVDVWLDRWELRVGDDLHKKIADAIAKSTFVAVAVSKNFSESKWIEGEVHQALSREKAENRTVVLPLLVEDVPLPPVLVSKKCLDFSNDKYFPSLARLAGMIHDIGPDSIDAGIESTQPTEVYDCVEVLRYCGFEPYCIVDVKTLEAVEQAGGKRSGSVVRFDPIAVRDAPEVSPAVREIVERLIRDWGLDR